MKTTLFIFFIALVLWFTPAWADHDGSEDICHDPAVFFCENWENHPVGNIQVYSSQFKNNGWAWSQFGSTMQIATDEKSDGQKSFKFTYPEGTARGYSGFGDTALPAKPTDFWGRWYTKYSSNFQLSAISTKSLEITWDISPVAINNPFIHLWGASAPVYVLTNSAEPGSQNLYQNVNQISDMDGSWQCYEVHLDVTNGSNASVEMWIDGVQTHSYLNHNLLQTTAAPRTILLSSYWNCSTTDCSDPVDDFHPLQFAWYDNIVMSTQRIGCLGTSAPPSSDITPPAAVSNLKITFLWDWLLSFIRG